MYPKVITDSEDHYFTHKDKFNLAYWILFLQGAGCLFPYNAFISAPDYFNTLYGESMGLYLAVAYSLPNVITQILVIKFGAKFPLWIKIFPTYLITIAILITIPVLGFCKVFGTLGLVLTLVSVSIVSTSNAILQSAVFGLANKLPPIYIQALMSGIGLSGVCVSLIRVITKATLERNIDVVVPLHILTLSAAIYFFVSASFVIICALTFFYILRSPFVQERIDAAELNQTNREDTILNDTPAKVSLSIWGVFKKIWYMCLLIGLVFVVTLSIFPGISVTIETHYPKSFMKEWLPILMVLICNLFDFMGRTMPRFVLLFNFKTVGIPVMLRVIFLPLFILCIYPRVILQDAFPLTFMALFSLSGGYLSSRVMMLAPSLVAPYEKETCGMLTNMFLLLGILVGSNLGLAIGKIVGLN